ncbi:hypothetical protein [Sphingomonas sp.]|uniref:hypothetical protein n=1 Tax=Sphingomonas sp. TaxID=28214 RepID=UPI001AFD7E4E|nr:hypothetical protein [Sphingomonas sp.]MBO9712586.1 hypothetical protein [Sphingomonas sp.]
MLGKPTASLSSGLLARKGHARPAMRPQGYMGMTQSAHEDLGWNDMGEELYPQGPQPAPAEAYPPVEAPEPPVLRQRAELEQQIAPEPRYDEAEDYYDETAEYEDEPAPVASLPVAEPRKPALPAARPVVSEGTLARVAREVAGKKAKAAFTLRLDHERHRRLRLASAISNLSAQQIVTEALDSFLDSLTDVDALVRELDARERN